jgi:ElaB/YqjD/DUF883 family membrane-anchored ribosome-binding protein
MDDLTLIKKYARIVSEDADSAADTTSSVLQDAAELIRTLGNAAPEEYESDVVELIQRIEAVLNVSADPADKYNDNDSDEVRNLIDMGR